MTNPKPEMPVPAFLAMVESQRAVAGAYYERHMTHVDAMLRGVTQAVEPTGSDALRPDLWKPEHWRWFFRVK